MARKLISYVNQTIEMDMEDLLFFMQDANKPNRHVAWLRPKYFAGYEHLHNGVVVVWESTEDESTTERDLVDAFIKQWEMDYNGEGEGLSDCPLEF